jgi:hypothetical protein
MNKTPVSVATLLLLAALSAQTPPDRQEGKEIALRDMPATFIGYTELRTNLPGGRQANVNTMRATLVQADGTGRRQIAHELINEAHTATQFAGWSPDGKQAVIGVGWKSPENAAWEEVHPNPSRDGKWLLFGSKRKGIRQLLILRLSDQRERQITNLKKGSAAMWAHWQPEAVVGMFR